MRLELINNSYINPLTGKAETDVFLTDGVLTDDPRHKQLYVSFWIQKQSVKRTLSLDKQGKQITEEHPTTIVLYESTLIFNQTDVPTLVTINNETKDLFKFLSEGGKLTGDEEIEIGYPSYDTVKKYLLKDNIGDFVEINPALDKLGKILAQKFIYEKVIINSEPIGKQFRFLEK